MTENCADSPSAAVHTLPATRIADMVRAGELSATDVVQDSVARISRIDAELGAFVHLDAERALARAAAVDDRVRRGDDPGPLAGVPLGVKELQAVRGWPLTYGSRLYAGHVADFTATVVERAVAAGAVPIGLTASPEFGRASFTASALHGVCRNPWDLTRTPGGSSGGSASAVAAGLVPLATGTDGAGSIRIPAAYTGLVGFKGTYGRVPRGPGFTGSAGNDHYGVLTRSVRDTARFLDCVCGADETDPAALPAPTQPFEEQLDNGAMNLGGLRIAWSAGLGSVPCEESVEATVREAAAALITELDGTEVEAGVKVDTGCGRAFRTLSAPEVQRMIRHAGAADLVHVHPTVRRYAEARPTADDVVEAHEARFRLIGVFAEAFTRFDLLLTPTTQVSAFAAEGPMPTRIAGQDADHWSALGLTFPFNLSGHPAVSVPAGTVDGTPVGLQIVGRRHEDMLVLATAARYERIRPWPDLAPMGR